MFSKLPNLGYNSQKGDMPNNALEVNHICYQLENCELLSVLNVPLAYLEI